MGGKTTKISFAAIALIVVGSVSFIADLEQTLVLLDAALQNHWVVSGLLLMITIGLFVLTYLILSVQSDGKSGRKNLHDKVDKLALKTAGISKIVELLAEYHKIDIGIAKMAEKEQEQRQN